MDKLSRIKVEGFKSIKELDLELGPINVMIGANGAGKSNFVSLFRMFNFMISGSLQLYISRAGGANALLYYGANTTPQMRVELDFETDTRKSRYLIRLMDAAPDTLVFAEEEASFVRRGNETKRPHKVSFGSGHRETGLIFASIKGKKEAVTIYFLEGCQVFQFHDTSESSRIRKKGNIEDNRFLYSDAGNLASYLYMLQESNSDYLNRIVSTIRLAAPHFGEFDLAPDKINPYIIMLNWRERGSDYLFGPHQLSDGLLRFMALSTLLLQPEDNLPDIIIIDEPELGLHPYAINLLGGLIRQVSHHCQVILATQSVNLLDQFEPNEVIVVERKEGASEFQRLSQEDLEEWLQEYSLSELWEKNVLGGRPSR